MSHKIIKIKEGEEYITLNVLLKVSGEIQTGGQAKIFLAESPVEINGEIENRRGRKLYPNDKVKVGLHEYLIQK